MIKLACDTSQGFCSLALYRDGETFFVENQTQSKQAEDFFALLDNLLDKAACLFDEINSLYVTVGPGSFTGIRIGVAAMRGMSIASNLPIYGMSTLAVLGHLAIQKTKATLPIIVLQDARRGEFFFQEFSSTLAPLTQPMLIEEAELPKYIKHASQKIVCGNAVPILNEKLQQALVNIAHTEITHAKYLVDYINSEYFIPEEEVFPIYVRKPDVS